jgi:hypothetical protein
LRDTSRGGGGTTKERDLARVLETISACKYQGATCDEVEQILRMTHQTCSARFNDLAGEGKIVRTEKRRKTRSSRPAGVYVAMEYALP